jgi:hypothetical protein
MSNNDNFDLVLAIPCETVKSRKRKPGNILDISAIAPSYLADIADDKSSCLKEIAASYLQASGGRTVKCGETELAIKNAAYDNTSNLMELAEIFCKQIEDHGKYELISNDKIRTKRAPLLFGQVILYKDEKNDEYRPECCYNFFCAASEATINKDNAFTIIYFVVPDINYNDLTLLIDQSYELWCNIKGNAEDSRIFLTDYLDGIGYKYFGKIYRIVFSDVNQFKTITEDEGGKTKLFNILASETYKSKEQYCHQLELSENTDEYSFSCQGNTADVSVIKREKFFDGYSMYSSYKAYASIYSYYYIINEEGKDIFRKRIAPDKDNENFSSEANILFVLETELFKISAGLALSRKINEQINNPNMREIQEMFRSFINTRPLFEKLTYCYLGAQKEADFIYKQFRIDDILTDYTRKRELLKSYSEVTTSITENNNSKLLNCIVVLFTLITGFDRLSNISHVIFDKEKTITWDIDYILPTIVSLIIIGIIIKIIDPLKHFKKLIKSLFRRPYTVN